MKSKIVVRAFGMNHVATQREDWIVDRRALCGLFWDTTSYEDVHLTMIDCQSCVDLVVTETRATS